MTDPSVPPGGASEQPTPSASGFFGWVRSLGIVRSDGWIGGVAAGIAVRIGIDPLIVRGLFVVLTLLGLPMVLLYAIAWALLPDADGSIHLQNMFRGRFDAPMIAILIVVVLNFVPVIPAVLGFGLWPLQQFMQGAWPYELTNSWDGGVVPVILSLALVALIIVAIIKASQHRTARRASEQTGPYAGYTQSGYPAPDGTSAAAAADPTSAYQAQGYAAPFPAPAFAAPAGQIGTVTGPATLGEAPTLTPPPTSAPVAAPAADAPGSAVGYDEWRRQHENWLGTNEQWRAQQADADKRAREQARTEAIARGQELSRQASEQARARRAANPRMSAGFVAAVVGVGVIAAAIVALLAASQGAFLAATSALLVAGAVGALGMVLAGLLRRRSGFLTFLTVSTLAVALPMGFIAAPFATDAKTAFALTSGSPDSLVAIGSMTVDGTSSDDREFVQFFGYTDVYVPGTEVDAADRGDISIVKGDGSTQISVSPGAELDLNAVLARGSVLVFDMDADTGEYTERTVSAATNVGDHVYDVRLTGADAGPATVTQSVDIVQNDDVLVYLGAQPKEENR